MIICRMVSQMTEGDVDRHQMVSTSELDPAER